MLAVHTIIVNFQPRNVVDQTYVLALPWSLSITRNVSRGPPVGIPLPFFLIRLPL